MKKISNELLLGLWLALESSAGDIERVRSMLRGAQLTVESFERADAILARAWLRIENTRRVLDTLGPRPVG